jgi:hypothetical protein
MKFSATDLQLLFSKILIVVESKYFVALKGRHLVAKGVSPSLPRARDLSPVRGGTKNKQMCSILMASILDGAALAGLDFWCPTSAQGLRPVLMMSSFQDSSSFD